MIAASASSIFAFGSPAGLIACREKTIALSGAGRGAIRFPERFTVRAPIFQGTVIVDTPHLIRYRIGDDGKLAFMVQMHQKDVRLRESFQAHCIDAFSRDSKLELPIYYVG